MPFCSKKGSVYGTSDREEYMEKKTTALGTVNNEVDFCKVYDMGTKEQIERILLANRILKRVRDFAQVKYDGRITKEVASFALDLLEVDRYGLDQTDRLLLTTIMEKFQGGPVGLDTLAASIGEDAGTIEDVYEPFLIKSGFINRTPRGRVATEFAWHHLGLEAPRKIEE